MKPPGERTITVILVVMALLVGALIFRLMEPSNKPTPTSQRQRIAEGYASAEYNCDEVKTILQRGTHFKLDVCGTVRWYRCKKSLIKTASCKEVKRKK